MHSAALTWVADHATDKRVAVLDIGGRDTGGEWGGSPRIHFPNARVYHVLDIENGPDVDIVADASAWTPVEFYDVVVTCEVFEHARNWSAIVGTAFAALKPGGRFIATMAGPGRPAHGALGAPELEPGEYYANVRPDRLSAVLGRAGFVDVTIDQQLFPPDVRATATKP